MLLCAWPKHVLISCALFDWFDVESPQAFPSVPAASHAATMLVVFACCAGIALHNPAVEVARLSAELARKPLHVGCPICESTSERAHTPRTMLISNEHLAGSLHLVPQREVRWVKLSWPVLRQVAEAAARGFLGLIGSREGRQIGIRSA